VPISSDRPFAIGSEADVRMDPSRRSKKRLKFVEARQLPGDAARPNDGAARFAQARHGAYKVRSFVGRHMAPNAAHEQDIGRPAVFVGRVVGGVFLEKEDMVFEAGLGAMSQAKINWPRAELDQPCRDVMAARVRTEDADDISTVAGAHAYDANRPWRRGVEAIAKMGLDRQQPLLVTIFAVSSLRPLPQLHHSPGTRRSAHHPCRRTTAGSRSSPRAVYVCPLGISTREARLVNGAVKGVVVP
jgi:hypothetical protein